MLTACATPLLGTTLASHVAFARLFPAQFVVLFWVIGVTFFLFSITSVMLVCVPLEAMGAYTLRWLAVIPRLFPCAARFPCCSWGPGCTPPLCCPFETCRP